MQDNRFMPYSQAPIWESTQMSPCRYWVVCDPVEGRGEEQQYLRRSTDLSCSSLVACAATLKYIM